MQDLYYIGEVSDILNISTQTLRYYDKIGIVQPAYVDPNTGYRKYTYDQIGYVDRIRYLQGLELNLQEISEAIQGNNINMLTAMLQRKAQNTQEQICRLESLLKELHWYMDYYTHINSTGFPNLPFRTMEPPRYLMIEPFLRGEPIYGHAGQRLMRRKSSNSFRELKYLRQVGYLLDYPSFKEGLLVPTHYFIYLKEKPNFENKHVYELPGGDYFCLRTKLLLDPLPCNLVGQYLGKYFSTPIMIANEYEDNFQDFKECLYELQIPLFPTSPI